MRHKIEGARSRTPSPMYLDLRGSCDLRSSTGADDLGAGSSVLTPRETIHDKSFGMDLGTNPFMKHVEKVPRAELWTKHVERDMGLPSQHTVWSTSADGTAHLAGYEHDLGNEYVEWKLPLSFQRDASSTFPMLANQWIPPPPAGFNQAISSTGSLGHPDCCQKPCKYLWKKRGCRDGALCSHCHLCPRKGTKVMNPPWQERANTQTLPSKGNVAQPRSVTEVSVGSLGHPLSCAHPCKYNCKKSGCKDGRLCDRCHLCRWDRSTDRERKNNTGAEAKVPKSTGTKEMGTQTTVDRCSQCDLGDEVLDENMCKEIIRELRDS